MDIRGETGSCSTGGGDSGKDKRRRPADMQRAAEVPPVTPPEADEGGGGPPRQTKPVRIFKRTFADAVTEAPSHSDETMGDTDEVVWFSDDIEVEPDANTEEN